MNNFICLWFLSFIFIILLRYIINQQSPRTLPMFKALTVSIRILDTAINVVNKWKFVACFLLFKGHSKPLFTRYNCNTKSICSNTLLKVLEYAFIRWRFCNLNLIIIFIYWLILDCVPLWEQLIILFFVCLLTNNHCLWFYRHFKFIIT